MAAKTEIAKAGEIARAVGVLTEFENMYSEEVIPFGAGVMRGTDPDTQCKLMTTGGKFVGVAVARGVELGEKREYPNPATITIVTTGQVYVQVTAAVQAGDVAACGEGGKWAKTGTGSRDDVNGVFMTSAESNGYAILKLK